MIPLLYAKTCIITEKITVEEALDDFKDEFSKAASHCHVKSIPEWEFQNDLKVDSENIRDWICCLTSVNYWEKIWVLCELGVVSISSCVLFVVSLSPYTDFLHWLQRKRQHFSWLFFWCSEKTNNMGRWTIIRVKNQFMC